MNPTATRLALRGKRAADYVVAQLLFGLLRLVRLLPAETGLALADRRKSVV